MKNVKYLLAGVLLGGAIFGNSSVLAGVLEVPKIVDFIKFKFNGEDKPLDNGYSVLMYQDRTYVPARFVAEELGAEVLWEDSTKTVLINKLNPTNGQNTSEGKSPLNFEGLPVSKLKNGFNLEVYTVDDAKEDRTTFYIRVKNTTPDLLQVDQGSAYFVADNVTYRQSDILDSIIFSRDKTWYNDIREDEKKEGYIMLPSLPKDIKEGTLYVNVIQNDGTNTKIPFEFNLKWN